MKLQEITRTRAVEHWKAGVRSISVIKAAVRACSMGLQVPAVTVCTVQSDFSEFYRLRP